MDPDVNVADNVLEGILGLDAFLVRHSRIKVIYLFILKLLKTFSSFTIILVFPSKVAFCSKKLTIN